MGEENLAEVVELMESMESAQEDACKNLWVMVIIQALQDANEAVLRAENKQQAINREMKYFRSRDFQLICALADIYINLALIEDRFRLLIKRNKL